MYLLDILFCNLTCDSQYAAYLLLCIFPFAAILYSGFVGNQDNLNKNVFFLSFRDCLYYFGFLFSCLGNFWPCMRHAILIQQV